MNNNRLINPVEIDKICVVCKTPKREKELGRVDDYGSEYDLKSMCRYCVSKNRTYLKCSNPKCDTIFNKDNREGKLRDLCTDCNAKVDEGNISDEEMENTMNYYDNR